MRVMNAIKTLTSKNTSTNLEKTPPQDLSYLVGISEVDKSFTSYLVSLIEICWGTEYPSELPEISLESFYNKHLIPEVKNHIIAAVKGRALVFE